jgi:hypothetical protein
MREGRKMNINDIFHHGLQGLKALKVIESLLPKRKAGRATIQSPDINVDLVGSEEFIAPLARDAIHIAGRAAGKKGLSTSAGNGRESGR